MNNEFYVNINTIDRVKEFIKIVSKYECDFDLINDRYIIDAKSIMGIFSLDLSKKHMLKVYSSNDDELNKIKNELDKFMVV